MAKECTEAYCTSNDLVVRARREATAMAFDEQAAIYRFWEARRSGDYFPTDWYNRLTVDQAFRIQLGVAARREAMGERRVGWKIGLTSDAAQCQFGLSEPVFGYLVDGGFIPTRRKTDTRRD